MTPEQITTLIKQRADDWNKLANNDQGIAFAIAEEYKDLLRAISRLSLLYS